MSGLCVTNIGELLTLAEESADRLGLIRDAALVIEDGRVRFVGPMNELPSTDFDVIDAHDALVTPGLVDPHAHPIFAGSRAHEFDLRAQGRSYGEIQAAGGGILATVRATNAATSDALLDGLHARLDRLLAHGVTCCEAKTGYALSLDGELRLLTLLGRARHPVRVSPTLLAHVLPPGLDEIARANYVHQFAEELIPKAVGLAEAVDVYCDAGAFTLDETRVILTAAKSHGFALRVHAEQFTHTGAAVLAAELGARSVEHLEQISDDAPARLAAAGTVCNLLPGAALTLRLPWPNARRFLDAGCTVALGTDCNPGSSLTENLPLMMSLACMQMGMSIAEAWRAVTASAARAIGRGDVGHLRPGARGDFVIWSCHDHREVAQHYGVNLVERVFVEGKPARPPLR